MKHDVDMNEELIEIMVGNDEGDEVAFYIIDKTEFKGQEYYLAVDNMEPDNAEEMLILLNVSENEDDLILEIVDDENLLNEISAVFEEQLDDTEIII